MNEKTKDSEEGDGGSAVFAYGLGLGDAFEWGD